MKCTQHTPSVLVRYFLFFGGVFLLFVVSLCGHAQTRQRLSWHEERRGGEMTLRLLLPPLRLVSVAGYAGGQIPLLEGGISWASAGAPDVPEVAYEFPVEGETGAVLLGYDRRNEAQHTGVDIAPASASSLVGRPQPPRQQGEIYSQDVLFPQDGVELSAPYYAGDGWYQTLYVRPYAYNPRQSIFYSCSEVVVRLSGVKRVVRRPQVATRGVLSTTEKGGLLVVTPSHYLKSLEPFLRWKQDRGLGVEVLLFGEGDAKYPNVQDTTALLHYLRERYGQSERPLKYVLLVGNRNEIPPLRRRGATRIADSDQAYGQMVGEDSRNEIYVGRFPAYTQEQLLTQIQRVLHYERDLTGEKSTYTQALCIASNEGFGIGDNGETDLEHSEILRETLLNGGYTKVSLLYDTPRKALSADTVASVISTGLGVINYIGHGYYNRWTTSGYSVNHIFAQEQTETHPVIFDVACSNGNMEVSPCFAEAWMWAQHRQRPSGAIGICASSEEQYWAAPMRAQDRMNDLLTKRSVHPDVVTLGGIVNAGITEMLVHYRDTPLSQGRTTAETWTLFGDPSVVLRSKVPERLSVTHETECYVSDTEFCIACSSENIEATLRVGYPSGDTVYFPCEIQEGKGCFKGLQLTQGASLHLTVWGLNKETYTADIPCTEGTSGEVRIRTLSLVPISVAQPNRFSAGDEWEVRCSLYYTGTQLPYGGLEGTLSLAPDGGLVSLGGGQPIAPFTRVNQEIEWVVGRFSISKSLKNQTPASLTVSVQKDGISLATRTYSNRVEAVEVRIPSLRSASSLIAQAGQSIALSVLLENKSAIAMKGGRLRLRWERENGERLGESIVQHDLATLAAYTRHTEEVSVTLPSTLTSMESVRLIAELWIDDTLHTQEALSLIEGLPIAPDIEWQHGFPFSRKKDELLETRYYFGEPVLEGGTNRIVGVQIPIFSSASELRVRGLYADILTLEEQKQELSSTKIEAKQIGGRDTVLRIANNYVTLPLPAFNYNEITMSDLVLRLQSIGISETSAYHIPGQCTTGVRTVRLSRPLGEEGVDSTYGVSSLPKLRFVYAQKTDFHFTVVDEGGAPVSFAKVDLFDQIYHADRHGEVTFSFTEGDYKCEVYSAEHGSQYFWLRLRKEHPAIRLVLHAPELQTVTCLLKDRVTEQLISHGEITYAGERVTSNEEGEYILHLPGGTRHVNAFAEGYYGGERRLQITGSTTRVELWLSPREHSASLTLETRPNPVHDILELSSQSLLTELRIYDLHGVAVVQQRLEGYHYSVALGCLPRGIYLLEVHGRGKGVVRRRIVKD